VAKTVQLMSANDRLKQSFESKLSLSLILATCVHLFVFVYFPEMTVDVRTDLDAVAVAIIPMEEIAIPVAPEPLASPAVPVAAIDVDATATIAPTPSWDDVTRPPPPPTSSQTSGPVGTTFVPFTVAPELLDPEGFLRHLVRAYPQDLRDSGVGGHVELLLHINEEGRVVEASIGVSSGYRRLDEAALGLVDRMRFRPALNRDKRVAVLVSVPLEFRVRD